MYPFPENPPAYHEPDPERAEDELRLTGAMVPSHYDIELRPDIYDPDGDFLFWGKVAITMKSHKTTNELILHIHELHITSDTIVVG